MTNTDTPKYYISSEKVTVEAVQLRASEPGDPVSFDHKPQWLIDMVESRQIRSILGDKIDGSDWVYLWLETGTGIALVTTDDYIVRFDENTVGTISRALFYKVFEPI